MRLHPKPQRYHLEVYPNGLAKFVDHLLNQLGIYATAESIAAGRSFLRPFVLVTRIWPSLKYPLISSV